MNTTQQKTMTLVLGIALATSAAAFAAPPKKQYVETFDQTYPLSAGGRLTLDNRNGGITIDTWDKEEIHVVAERRMRPSGGGASWLLRVVGLKSTETATDEQAEKLFEELRIEVTGDSTNRIITTHYPQVHGVEFDVTYRITAPRRMIPSIDTMNSTVQITGVEGDTAVDTTNGSVILSGITGAVRASSTNGRLNLEDISGAIEGETTNGSVSVKTRTNTPIGGPIRLTSTNGSVGVVVPAQASFNLELRTVNGSASCDLPLASTQEQSRKRLEGTVGAGGPLIQLRTTNGSVRVETAG